MSHPALNLTARDFDAYAAEKATSNAYSRPRLEVKQRALAWARAVVARLAALGIDADVHGSDEHPTLRNKKRADCQWVFFWRDQTGRDELDRLQGRGRTIAAEIDDPSPFTRHAFLALRIDASAVEVCFAVHPDAQVDADNLRARLAEANGASELMDALRALPEQFTVGVCPDDRVPASALTLDAFRALIPRAEGGQVPLWIGWSVPRETALEHAALFERALEGAPDVVDAPAPDGGIAPDPADRAPTLDEQLEDAIIALAPIYRLIAWSRDNDRIALDRRLESAEQERARTHAEAEAQTERWRAEQAEARKKSAEQARARPPAEPLLLHDARPGQRSAGPSRAEAGARPRKPSLDTLFAKKAPPAARSAPAAPASTPPAPSAPASTPPAPSAPGPSPLASEGNGERAAGPAPAIEKGLKVRVLSGPFVDKVGVVGELDGRGGARVHLGLLSTRLEIADIELVVEARERPALQSSHRRPLAPAPRKAR